ncbi:paraplegin [Trichuris trichiura]|uniref:Paraplegin n=1 Tax=Trichuris trichiura TaxID=36087 RepID=A0A077Z6U4_TRITR|nr:paraplegin [Trichuris trichiura]
MSGFGYFRIGRLIWAQCRKNALLLHRTSPRFQSTILTRCLLPVRNLHTTSLSCQQNKPEKDENDKDKPGFDFSDLIRATLYTIGIAAFLSLFSGSRYDELRLVPWNFFLHEMLAKGEPFLRYVQVEELLIMSDSDIITIRLHPGAIIHGQIAPTRIFHTRVPDIRNVEELIRREEEQLGISAESGVSIVFQRRSNWPFLFMLAFFSYMIFRTLFSIGKGGKRLSMPDIYGNLRKAQYRIISPFTKSGVPKIKFSDVVGLQEAKVEVMEFVDYLKKPDAYTRLGAKLPRGALLLGPPGCGKTLIAKAVASEASVPFLAINGTEFVEIIGGLGAARVRDLFKEAKRLKPCIVYIDEIDAVGRKRSDAKNVTGFQSGEEEQTLNQLLVEMDGNELLDVRNTVTLFISAGIDTNAGVIVLASTNRPDVLDKAALLRRGRFDRHILIDLPNMSERKEIFKYYLQKIKTSENIPDSAYLADRTPGYSGADIMNVCNEAAIRAATLGKDYVDSADLEYALERTLSGAERKTTSVTLPEKERIAYHESGHALVGWMLKHTNALLKISIVPRTKNITGMGFSQHAKTEKWLLSKDELLEKMSMALGGRAAEALVYGSVSTGAEDDLQSVTRMAYRMIKQFGMSEHIGPIAFPKPADGEESVAFLRKPYSKYLQALMDQASEARQLIEKAYALAEKILRSKRSELELLTKMLLERESLTYEQIVELIGPPAHGPKELTNKELQFPEESGSNKEI